MRPVLLGLALLPLAGCGALPAGGQLAIAALGYIASVNNLGAQTLKFVDDKKSCPASDLPPIGTPAAVVTLAAQPVATP
jgi:hypothetical protein